MDQGGSSVSAVKLLDAASLRGLAHPARVQILDALRLDGPATVSGLAARFGLRTGSVSWHLRKLAEHGFIEEIPGRGSGRERWWRAVGGLWSIDVGELSSDAELHPLVSSLLGDVLQQHFARAQQFVQEGWSPRWRSAGVVRTHDALAMTPEMLAAMDAELWSVIERYAAQAESSSPCDGAERVVVQIQAFPYRARGTEESVPPPEPSR